MNNNGMNNNSIKKKKIKIMICSIIIVFIGSIIFAIYYVQPSLFFHPWHDADSYQYLQEQNDFEELKIDNNGKILSGWIKKNTSKKVAPLIIMFGGNIQNSSNTCKKYLEAEYYQYFDEYNFMIVDYPGYGLSEGKPSEKTMFKAALTVYDYASSLDFVEKNNIVVMGYSIGSGVATYLASQRDVNGLILIAPYDELLSIYNSYANIFYGPIKLLARYKFKSIKYAQDVKIAPLIITSYDDELIKYQWSQNLSNYFNDVEKFVILDNGIDHASYFGQEEVWNDIYEYLSKREN